MKPEKMTVYELFKQQKRYAVPLYQRPYVWQKEERWVPLWEDIAQKAAAIHYGHQVNPHFLGAVVLQQVATFGKQLACSQVIDGQQRLTTLQVLLAAFRDLLAEQAAATEDTQRKSELGTMGLELGALTRHEGVMAEKYEAFKVWPTNEDRTIFKNVVTSCSREALERAYPVEFEGKRKKKALPGPLLVECYRFFNDSLREFFADPPRPASLQRVTEPTNDAQFSLLQALKQALHLVVIELEERDDPQVIFETLNARGEPLLPSDLIRNFVFGQAALHKENSDELYIDLWREYDAKGANDADGFWKQKLKVGRELRPRLDLFFQHYLVCQSEEDISLNHLYEEFKGWWSNKALKPRAGLEQLKRFSGTYRQFLEPEVVAQKDSRLAWFLHGLQILEQTTAYPLLLHILVETKLTVSERDQLIDDLTSFLVRRWVCGVTSKNYNRIFAGLLHEVRTSSESPGLVLRNTFLAQSRDNRWPDDREFEAAWLNAALYERVDSPGIQFLLESINRNMTTSKQEQVAWLGKLSVEHVMPQGWREHWPAPEATTDLGSEETAEERRDRLLHSVGNLTLLTQGLNTAVSNGPYNAKRPEITKQSLLLLNAYFQDAPTWGEQEILQRGSTLFAVAKGIWSHP